MAFRLKNDCRAPLRQAKRLAIFLTRIIADLKQSLVLVDILVKTICFDFFCVGVMYSGEYDACDVTLSVYPLHTG